MLPNEILRKVKLIELTTRKVVDDVMGGQYKSHFKGHGVQFSEHRLYIPGDDIRHIDWKVSARSRDPLIKKYDEERELTVLLVIDVSGSTAFGSQKKLKSEVAAEIAGMLAYAALHTGDKVGVLLFAGEIELIVPPKKGRQHVLRIIRDVLAFKAKTKGTNLSLALDAAARIMKHCGVVFVLSDFRAAGFDIPLKRLGRKHDVVAISVEDEREKTVPDVGNLFFIDPETGAEAFIDSSSFTFKKWMQENSVLRESLGQTVFKTSGVEYLRILTKEDHGDAVVKFFRTRSKRRRS